MYLKSIFKRSNGYYCAEYYPEEKGEDLKRISLKVKPGQYVNGVKLTESEARKEAWRVWNNFIKIYQEKEKKKIIGEVTIVKKLDDGIDEYLLDRSSKLQKSTFESDRYSIYKFKEFLEKENVKFVGDINKKVIDKFIDILDQENRSNKTINNYLVILNTMFKFFIKQEYLLLNMLNMKKHRRKNNYEKIQIINIDDAREILEEFKTIIKFERRLFMITPFFTGMRFSEIKGLNRKNINFKNRVITICEKQTCRDETPVSLLKSSAAYRPVPIIDEYYDLLYDYLNFTKEDYPFSTVTYATPQYYSDKIKEKYNLNFSIHHARHFFASLLIDSGFSILEVQKILGHSSVKITVDTYGHLIKNWDIERFNRIEFYKK